MEREKLINETIKNVSRELTKWYSRREPLYEVAILVLLFTCAISFILNSAVITVNLCYWRRTIATVTRVTLGLAGADAAAAIVMGVGFLVNAYLAKVKHILIGGPCFVLVLEAFRLGLNITCVFHLLLMSKLQHLAVSRPSCTLRMTWKITLSYLTLIWLTPSGLLLAIFLFASLDDGQCELKFLRQLEVRAPFSVIFVLVWLSMFILHIDTYRLLKKSQCNFQRQQKSLAGIRRKRQAMITTSAILMSSLIAWIPANLMFVLTADPLRINLFRKHRKLLFFISTVVNLLLVGKLMVNPLIYSCRIPEFQNSLRRVRNKIPVGRRVSIPTEHGDSHTTSSIARKRSKSYVSTTGRGRPTTTLEIEVGRGHDAQWRRATMSGSTDSRVHWLL